MYIIVKNGLKHFESQSLDVIIIDTAGRHKEEHDLLEEMGKINKVAEPDLALLVIDGTIGQQCFNQAEAFHKTIPVGGIVISKLAGFAFFIFDASCSLYCSCSVFCGYVLSVKVWLKLRSSVTSSL